MKLCDSYQCLYQGIDCRQNHIVLREGKIAKTLLEIRSNCVWGGTLDLGILHYYLYLAHPQKINSHIQASIDAHTHTHTIMIWDRLFAFDVV